MSKSKFKRSKLKFSKFLERVNNSSMCFLDVHGRKGLACLIERYPFYYDDNQLWQLEADGRVVWTERIHTYNDREYYEKLMSEPDKQKFIRGVMNMGTELLFDHME